MAKTLVEQLAEFTAEADYASLPTEVVEESKRLLLDSIGCALGGTTEPKGKIGLDLAQVIGGSSDEATILGTDRRSSAVGAAFANGELIQALDFDAVLPPGHVSPYVLPGVLARGEITGAGGRAVIEATAVAHEMSYRFGKAMDYTRDIAEDGSMALPPVAGYSSTVFGATAALGRLAGSGAGVLANSLGIAGAISPVNSHGAWMQHAPSPTIKYTMAGVVAQSAFTAAVSAELGHRGDLQVLDDLDRGYRRFIATGRWVPEVIADQLGTSWRFPAESTLKPYPHCRVLHAPLDALTELLETHDIRPEEITELRAWGEGWIDQPVWTNNVIDHVQDAQFSVAHGLALGAHRVVPSRAWQDPELVFGDSVMGLMKKVRFQAHPDYVAELRKHPASRPSRIEVDARGTTFTAERTFPKGSPSPDPSTRMTDEEVVAKFLVNAEGVLPEDRAREVAETVMRLETVENVADVVRALVPAPVAAVV